MQERQNRLITAIKCAAESIVITSPSGEIIFVNPAFEKLTGYTADEVIDKTPKILQSGVHDETFYRDLWQTILAGRVWVGRFTNRKKDGTTYLEEATISPVRDEQGKIINFVAVKKDITKEVALERQLNQAQKLESIGILAAGMAHEINTPIQYLLSNTHFLHSIKRDLRKRFTIHTAGSGADALDILKKEGPFAVIVSDMHMPVMDGIQLLAAVKAQYPETVRLMLTGNADQETAIEAVNKGQIFRFLNKPCPTSTLAISIALAPAAISTHSLCILYRVQRDQGRSLPWRTDSEDINRF